MSRRDGTLKLFYLLKNHLQISKLNLPSKMTFISSFDFDVLNGFIYLEPLLTVMCWWLKRLFELPSNFKGFLLKQPVSRVIVKGRMKC